MDIGKCFDDALAVYKKNWLMLVIAAVLLDLLSGITLFLLAGPLYGGACVLALNGIQNKDLKVDLGDLFRSFERFFTLLGLFLLTTVAITLGLALCIAPGLYLSTIWMFPFYFVVHRRAGLFESLHLSYSLTARIGFWQVCLLMLIELGLTIVPWCVPYVGFIIVWFTAPIGWLVVASAYLQAMRGNPEVASAAAVA